MTRTKLSHLLFSLLMGAVFICLAFCMGSCSDKFEKFKRQYGKTFSDTTYTTVKLTVPRDSAVLVVKTDTTRIREIYRQGRATVIYTRTPTSTTVMAECDSATLAKSVATKIDSTTIGVDPEWQTKAQNRMNIIWVLVGLIVLAVVIFLFLRKFQITARQSVTPPSNVVNADSTTA